MVNRTAHDPGLGMRRQQRHVLSNEIRRDQGMAIDPHDDLAARSRHREVQAGRNDAARIVDDDEPGMLGLQGSQNLACAVGRLPSATITSRRSGR